MRLSTDYLVVGAGASALAFIDGLLAEADADVIALDRREAPGGHWQDAYPFVRLHSPSAYYGVNSLRLGGDLVDADGENAGFYERASGAQVRDYFALVATRLAQTGKVRMLGGHEHLGGANGAEQVRELASGALHEIEVRRKVVDARYLEASIPATHRTPFDVAAQARVVPVSDLPPALGSASSYVVLGAGKTAVDACVWLLDSGVAPDRIRWIRPRDAWFNDRRHFQPLGQVAATMEGISLDAEAGAQASSLQELFEQLEGSGRLVRIDPSHPAGMYRGTMLSPGELAAVRQIEDVVRLGRVVRVEADRIVLERGETATDTDALHVDCTALGLSDAPAVPVFASGRIVLQQVRHLSPCFNAALVGFVEARRDADAEKNRLCPPNPYPRSIGDWPRMVSRSWRTEARWMAEPDVAAWVAASRLNLVGALPDHVEEPQAQAAIKRYLANVGGAIQNLRQLHEDRPSAQHDSNPNTKEVSCH